jgi:predicted tellurium resistance membrane protein TerC
MLELIPSPSAWLALLTLAALEIVLGIDNLIFISILVGRLPEARRRGARLAGLGLAMLTRVALLYSVVWLTHLSRPWFRVEGRAVSIRDVVLLAGGLFLLAKGAVELHAATEREAPHASGRATAGFATAVAQIAIMDIVFSFDSVFTAVGLANDLPIMVAAIVVSIVVMMAVSAPVGAFIGRHPTLKVLALAFLILIGAALTAQALHFDIPKGYLYFAMGFATAVELVNIRARRVRASRG